MYSVSVRDHFMIAHSFAGEVFGPAQRLHGATYVVDVEFRRPELGSPTASSSISAAPPRRSAPCCASLNYRNLDEDRDVRRAEHHHGIPGAYGVRPASPRAIRRGDLGPGARADREPARHAARIARGQCRVRGAGEPATSSMSQSGSLSLIAAGPISNTLSGAADRTTAAFVAGLASPRLVASPCTRSTPSFPAARRRRRVTARRVELAAIPDGSAVLVDGLALGAMPDEVEREHTRLKLDCAGASSPRGRNRTRPRHGGTSSSRASGARLRPCGSWSSRAARLPAALRATMACGRDRIAVVEPGTDRAAQARGSDGRSCSICCASRR